VPLLANHSAMTRSPLFRAEAVRAAGDISFGSPIALLPKSWWALTGFFALFGAATITFLATATFPRKESAAGILRYSQGELRITAPRPGIVTAIHVRDGQTVAAGDLLAYVNTEQLLALGEVYDARVAAAVARQRRMLEDRLAGLNASEPLQAASLRERAAGIDAQLVELEADRVSRARTLRIAVDSMAGTETLANQGVYSAEQRRAKQTAMLQVEQTLIEVRSQIAGLLSQRTDLALQLARLPVDIGQTRASILQELAGIEAKTAEATAQNGFALIARAAGVVTALQTQLGQPVDPSRPLMTIVPSGSELQAELYVPSRAAGFIAEGQVVRLLYDAFPYTRFGPGFGTIGAISTAVLRPEEVGAAVTVKEPVYRVVVTLKAAAMQGYGRMMPLQSGMALTADILLEDRSFLDLLLDPLRAATRRTLG
jgi:membrane fusion protein